MVKNILYFCIVQTFTGTDKVFVWKSKGLLEETIKTPVISGNKFNPKLNFICNGAVGAKFKGNCLMQDNRYHTSHYS